MKNYYFILGLNINASEAEIKSAYRRLALQFHPDKNPSPEAETIIKEINEAYEVLGDTLRKILYDQMLKGEVQPEVQQPVPQPHRDPRYRPRAKSAGPRRPSHREELQAMMAEKLNYALLASRVAFIFAIVVFTDLVIPKQKDVFEIVGYQVQGANVHSKHGRPQKSYKMLLRNGSSFIVTMDAGHLLKGSSVALYSTTLFNIPYRIEDREANAASFDVSIFGNFIFGPLVLLLTSLVGVFYKQGIEFRFNLGVVNFFLLLLNLIFLQIHKF